MTYAGSPEPRATVSDSPEGFEVVMPAPRMWLLIVFLGLWLAGWATGEAFALRGLLTPAPLAVRGFLVVWLAFWTVGGASALSLCALMLAGHERVRLRPDVLVIQRELLGMGPTKTYTLDRVSNLRAQDLPPVGSLTKAPGDSAPLTPEQAASALRFLGIGGPGISFDYAGKPVRFGLALEAMEARQIVAQLQARHAFPERQAAA
jgi:hypothetical protein